MGMGKKLGAVGVARMVYTEARKPENQRRIKAAVAKVKQQRDARRRPAR